MAGPFKVVLFFNNQGNGWSETYYTATTDLGVAFTRALGLKFRRLALMAEPVQLQAVRVSDEANPRLSQLTPLQDGPSGTYVSRSDRVSAAWMMRMYTSANFRTRALFLRGNPDDSFNLADPNNADAQQWSGAFAAFGDYLKGSTGIDGQVWLVKFRPPDLLPNRRKIAAWTTSSPSTNSLVTTGVAHGLVEGQFVDTYRMKGLPFAPGQVRVVKVDPDSPLAFEVRYRTPQDYDYPGGGYYQVWTQNYELITSYAAFPRATSRDTGRPSDLSRGRRRSIPR